MKTGIRNKLIQGSRIVKTGAQNFLRNATLAVAAIAIMVITLSIILFSLVANATFVNTISQITDRIDVSIYLDDEITREERQGLVAQLESLENVERVEFISKDDALEIYKEQNKDNLELLTAISQTDNPLPASLRVKPVDVNRIEDIRVFIEQPEIKELQSEEPSYSGDRKEAIDSITEATGFMQTAGVVGVVVFAVVSILIIFNTIRMAIFNRREELTIMRLLGAETWYIRGPFIVETIIYGVVAAILSILIVQGLFTVSSGPFGASSLGLLDIEFASTYFNDNYVSLLILQLGLGVAIGAVSSYVATKRYLKFKAPKKN
jgi:cell division transport system permease protein